MRLGGSEFFARSRWTVSYSRIGVGVINTQHYAHSALGQRVLDEMDAGDSRHDALKSVLRGDPEAESRQLIAIDASFSPRRTSQRADISRRPP